MHITTALVNSSQFNVVERMKLKSVLEELKLNQAGLIDSKSAQRIGRLLGADSVRTLFSPVPWQPLETNGILT